MCRMAHAELVLQLGLDHIQMLLAVLRHGTGVLEKGTLAVGGVAHDQRKRRLPGAQHGGGIDIGVAGQLLQNEIALRVMPGDARGVQLQGGVQPGQIGNDVAHGAAGGAPDAGQHTDQLALCGPAFDGVGDIHQHIAGAADAFTHRRKSPVFVKR